MKVYFESDECYPVYTICEEESWEGYYAELTEEEYKTVLEAEKLWEKKAKNTK